MHSVIRGPAVVKHAFTMQKYTCHMLNAVHTAATPIVQWPACHIRQQQPCQQLSTSNRVTASQQQRCKHKQHAEPFPAQLGFWQAQCHHSTTGTAEGKHTGR
jgi:hypothetical protein